MKQKKSMKLFSVLRYITLGGILGYLVFEAIVHGYIDRYAQIPAFHAICPFEAFGTFLTKMTNLEFFSNPFASASIFFLFLLIFSILLNRVFCGFFCAFGALQEFLGNLGAKVLKNRIKINPKLDKTLKVFKYIFLVLSIALAYLTSFEFFTNLIGTNDGAYAFSNIDPWIAFKNLLSNNLIISGYIASFVVLIISLICSFFFQRFYCKYICPLGATTAIFGSLSGLHIHKNPVAEDLDLCNCDECDACSECHGFCQNSIDNDNIDSDSLDSTDDNTNFEIEVDETINDDQNAIGIDSEEDFKITEDLNEIIDESNQNIDECENQQENCDEIDVEEFDYEFEDEYDDEDEIIDDNPLSKFIANKSCIQCGKCSEICPMGIDVANSEGNIDFAECIHCQKCVAICPTGALETKYFKARVHPLVIFIISFILFFGAAIGFNFIKIDLDKDSIKTPLYDSIRLAPQKPDDGTFSIQQMMEAYEIESFADLKTKFYLDDTVNMQSTYSQFTNGMKLEFFKNNDIDKYNDYISFFNLDEATASDLTVGQVYDNASIKVTSEYLGFDPDKANDFAAYFNASAEDKFSKISKEFFKMYDEYDKYVNTNQNEWNKYISDYGYWYQDYYGAKYTAAKNFYELFESCAYEKDLTQYFAQPKFTVQYLCDTSNMTLEQLKEEYHLSDAVTLRSPYSVFFNNVKFAYYKEAFENSEDSKENPNQFEDMLSMFGMTIETYDPEMTIGEGLDTLTLGQAAVYFGCETEEDLNSFLQSYNASSADELFKDYHEVFNKQMDDYYDMMYNYSINQQQ